MTKKELIASLEKELKIAKEMWERLTHTLANIPLNEYDKLSIFNCCVAAAKLCDELGKKIDELTPKPTQKDYSTSFLFKDEAEQ